MEQDRAPDDGAREQMNKGLREEELRERAVLPILIPLAAIVLIEIIVFSMSRVLLATGRMTAVAVALGTAIAILAGASFIAARPRFPTRTLTGLLTVLLIGAVAAGAIALKEGPAYLKEEAASRPKVAVTAKNLAFSVKTLKLAHEGTIVDFTNADTQPHNMAVYASKDKLDQAFFKGQITQPASESTYEIGKLAPGKYYFHCDIHPTMNGEAVVS